MIKQKKEDSTENVAVVIVQRKMALVMGKGKKIRGTKLTQDL